MTTVLDLARRADVSAKNVLRVLNGEPVSEEVRSRVGEAIDELGSPDYPAVAATDLMPAEAPAPVAPDREEVFERFAQTAAELETSLPEDVGSVVYEALRVEVRPVAQHVAELSALFEALLRQLERLGEDVGVERRERVEDVALLTELITTGWSTVDRRLGRLEQIVTRLESEGAGRTRLAYHGR